VGRTEGVGEGEEVGIEDAGTIPAGEEEVERECAGEKFIRRA